MGKESYKHLYAKRLVIEWLKNSICKVNVNEDKDHHLINLHPIRSLNHKDQHNFGIYEEYPVCLTNCGKTTIHKIWKDKIPTFEELIKSNNKPAFIFDIAISDMGSIKYAIEVVNTNPVPQDKINFLSIATYDIPFELYEIDAEWILQRTEIPSKLELKKLLPKK